MEILARRGMVPLFIGNKPIEDAGKEVQKVNQFRAEEGFKPCQPKNVMMVYCVANAKDAEKADQWLLTANRDVNLHYGFADPSNFVGVKGYESYAARQGAATAVLAAVAQGKEQPVIDTAPKLPGYHPSNLIIGTPEECYRRIAAAQQACSFSELTLVPQFGVMPYDEAMASTRLFAAEVLPELHKLDARLHEAALPEPLPAAS
jgi:alkanesulfonate monooxygenase SsuD/methylene tetrahydromethanopterin reductase-like flavin-dependent oxidoreductase (luciferase family)